VNRQAVVGALGLESGSAPWRRVDGLGLVSSRSPGGSSDKIRTRTGSAFVPAIPCMLTTTRLPPMKTERSMGAACHGWLSVEETIVDTVGQTGAGCF
jgi:hypothetical protein